MTLTNPAFPLPAPETSVSAPGWVHRHMTWVLLALVVLAAVAVVSVAALDGGSTVDSTPVDGTFETDRGSITAIDHRAAAAGSADRGGIAAIEHRAEPTAGGSLRHESIAAIDHRTAPQGR